MDHLVSRHIVTVPVVMQHGIPVTAEYTYVSAFAGNASSSRYVYGQRERSPGHFNMLAWLWVCRCALMDDWPDPGPHGNKPPSTGGTTHQAGCHTHGPSQLFLKRCQSSKSTTSLLFCQHLHAFIEMVFCCSYCILSWLHEPWET